MGSRKTFATREALEWRRMRGLALVREGWSHRRIAKALGVTEAAVSKWMAEVRTGGARTLKSHPSPGRPPKLSLEERRLIPDLLWHGAEAYGFRGAIWTTERVSEVLELEFGITYSRSQVSRLLKSIHWTPQIPIARAIQRDERAIRHWRKHHWPEILARAQREHRILVFIDESGFYFLPGVVRTYAPEALTPVLHEYYTRNHLSVMGAMTINGGFYTLVRQTPLTSLETCLFLVHLLHVAADKLLVIWDRSPIHTRGSVPEFLANPQLAGRIHIELLPPYAPDLNPIEGLWQHLKHVELRNVTAMGIEELHSEFHLAMSRIRKQHRLLKAFIKGAGLMV